MPQKGSEQGSKTNPSDDIGWNYATMATNPHDAICDFCKRSIKGGITRVKEHLACKRGNVVPCSNVPEEVREQMVKHLQESKEKRKMKQKKSEELEIQLKGAVRGGLGNINVSDDTDSDHELTLARIKSKTQYEREEGKKRRRVSGSQYDAGSSSGSGAGRSFKDIVNEHERIILNLEGRKREFAQCELELWKRKVYIDFEKKMLQFEMKMNKAALEQRKEYENVIRLAKEQKEKEKLHKRIIELEKKLEEKKAYENVMSLAQDQTEKEKLHKRNIELEKKLEEKEDELEDLEAFNEALVIKERQSYDELQKARKELINALKGQSSQGVIGVKRMGELDNMPFHNAAKRKYSKNEVGEKAMKLCSLWKGYLKDPSWHPFKVIKVEGGNDDKEVIDEEDEKLKDLKIEFGNEVYMAVTTALMEMNEYSPRGRHVTPELWNYKEKRKATLNEGVSYIIKQWRSVKMKTENV